MLLLTTYTKMITVTRRNLSKQFQHKVFILKTIAQRHDSKRTAVKHCIWVKWLQSVCTCTSLTLLYLLLVDVAWERSCAMYCHLTKAFHICFVNVPFLLLFRILFLGHFLLLVPSGFQPFVATSSEICSLQHSMAHCYKSAITIIIII